MSLELEIEVKVKKLPETEEERHQSEADRIIGRAQLPEDIDLNDENKFEYRRIIVKLNQLEGRGDFDGEHTVLYLPYGVFLARVPFDQFNIIYETMMGLTIKRISDFKFVREGEEGIPTKRKRN